jgi:gluconolactonase
MFSDIPNNRMMRWTPDGTLSVFRAPSNFSNGNTRDREGRLVTCHHGSRSVTRTEHDGSITVLADSFGGRRLNSPNDVVVRSDGTIWFTDPTYGIRTNYEGDAAEPEQETRNVYRLDPATGEISIAVDDFIQPNGLAFSPDESVLYVADSGSHPGKEPPAVIRAFDVGEDGRLGGDRVFARIDTGIPDGFRVDTEGRVWSSARDGVHCFAPDGELLGKILVPEVVSNLCFGGPRGIWLLITATTSVYRIAVNASSCVRF